MARTAVRICVRIGLIALALLVAAMSIVAAVTYDRYTKPGPLTKPITVIIKKGSGVAQIADQLARAGIVETALVFRAGVRFEGRDNSLRAGEFKFPARISMRQSVAVIASGKTVKRRLTVAEGLTTLQVLAVLSAATGLEGPVPDTAAKEGGLLPETYFYAYGDSRAGMIDRMKKAMDSAVADAWSRRPPDLAIRTPKEALVLASLIEKETGIAAERVRVSAVFHNRLRRGMRLQTDPTVVYAIAGGVGSLHRPLTRRDLKFVSPYNTYLNAGLPPGPIANPGQASLSAAVNPSDHKDLYFVANGKGGHLFARTLKQHNRNVARWRRLQRERDRPETPGR